MAYLSSSFVTTCLLRAAKFAQEWGFTITTTSPIYPQSNGLAERNVQTMKQLLRKAMHQGTDPYLALLDFRASPITGLKVSPAELLMGRKLKTKLPSVETLLQPMQNDGIVSQLGKRQQQQKKYYDRGAREAPEVHPGDIIRVQRGHQWEAAVVTGSHSSPRSFTVQQGGRTLRRNRRHLRLSKEPLPASAFEPDEMEDSTTSPVADEPPAPAKEEAYVKSSGRTVRRPARYNDYV